MAAMASVPSGSAVTLEEFRRMPEEDEHRVELSYGRVVREPRPGARHGVLVGRILSILGPWVRERGVGLVVSETGFLLPTEPPSVRGPDVAFIAGDPAARVPEGWWEVPPTLAVEVVSPSNSAVEIQAKVIEYLDAGTRLVWVVDPRTRTVTEWRPSGEGRVRRPGEILEPDEVLPGFTLPVSEVFGLSSATD